MEKSIAYDIGLGYKLMYIIKSYCTMSLCTIWEKEKGKKYYIASDTRAIDFNGNVLDEKRRKVIIFRTLPLILVSTGFASFTKSNLTMEQYLLQVENNLNFSKNIEENIYKICSKLQEGMEKCIESFPHLSKDNCSMETLFLYRDNQSQKINQHYRENTLKNDNNEPLINAFSTSYPVCIDDTIILGDDMSTMFYKTKKENQLFTNENFIPLSKALYQNVIEEMRRHKKVTVNNKLDILKVTFDEIQWLEQNSI